MAESHQRESGAVAERGWLTRDQEGRPVPRPLAPLLIAEDALQYLVALLLLGLAVAVLFKTGFDLVTTEEEFFIAVPNAVNNVLFVIIVLEIFSTIVSHFRSRGFQLKPFLIIGIISAVRHILTIGARLSAGAGTSQQNHVLAELGVNAAVALGLVVALVLILRCDALASIDDET